MGLDLLECTVLSDSRRAAASGRIPCGRRACDGCDGMVTAVVLADGGMMTAVVLPMVVR